MDKLFNSTLNKKLKAYFFSSQRIKELIDHVFKITDKYFYNVIFLQLQYEADAYLL